jgi:hypothetical protein
MHPSRLPFVAIFGLCFSALTVSAITIDSFSTDTNDRFDNDGSFVLNGFDLSGVGFSSDGRWGTLVSNNVFISANHLHPSVGQTLTFHATNDPNGAPITRTVTSGQRIGTTDLWVGVLSAPVTGSYTSYSLQTADIANSAAFSGSLLDGATGYMVGRSSTNWASNVHDIAVGTNVFDAWVEDSTAGGSTDDALSAIYQFGPNDTTYEALLQGGDSGAPLFVISGSDLVLTGVNWWVGTAEISATTYDLSGFSYVGNYDVEISNFISANAVPEPSTYAALLGLAGLGWANRRRRRANR